VNLPNYFLVDVPAEAQLSSSMLTEACQTLKSNRAQFLLHRTTQALVEVLSRLAKSWLEAENPFRKLALEHGPSATGFSRQTLASGLDAFFKQLTPANFQALLEQELGQPRMLDEFTPVAADDNRRRNVRVRAPELLVHIAAGNLPNPALMSLVLGVLARSAQFMKCASGGSFLPRLFAHSLYEAEPKLGACLEVAEWPGGKGELEKVLFEEGDYVTATGTDEALASIRQRMPQKTRFLGYGHRVSFGYVAAKALESGNLRVVIKRAATDVVAWNQLGCLSPHVIYVQTGMVRPEKFAEALAEALTDFEASEPRGELKAEAAAAITSRRAIYEMRAAQGPETQIWASKNSTAWTVIYEAEPRFQTSCLNRFIYIKAVEDLRQTLQAAENVRGQVATVGLAAPGNMVEELVNELAQWGVERICSLGQMQNPPLTWHHDGRPPLGDLIRWTDWEWE
jgi:hypothetical protein